MDTYVSDEQASVILIQGQMCRTDTSGNSLVQHHDRPVRAYLEAEHLALYVSIAVDDVLVSPVQLSKSRKGARRSDRLTGAASASWDARSSAWYRPSEAAWT
jgi:hypothetical protein